MSPKKQGRSAPETVSAAALTIVGPEVDDMELVETEGNKPNAGNAEVVTLEEPTAKERDAFFKFRKTAKTTEVTISGPQWAVVTMVGMLVLLVIVALVLKA